MTRLLALLAPLYLGAPFQCASDPDPARRLEDSPSEALWALAERFEAEGNGVAQRTTLEQLVAEYPTSREAARAERILAADSPADVEATTPTTSETTAETSPSEATHSATSPSP